MLREGVDNARGQGTRVGCDSRDWSRASSCTQGVVDKAPAVILTSWKQADDRHTEQDRMGPRSARNIRIYTRNRCRQGFFLTVFGAAYNRPDRSISRVSSTRRGRKSKRKRVVVVPPARPILFRRMSSEDQIRGRNGRPACMQVQAGSRLPASPRPLSSPPPGKVSINQIDPPGYWTLGRFCYLPTPRPTRETTTLLPSRSAANTGLREQLSHGPWTRPGRGWRSGGHTHSQPRLPACTIPEWGSNWFRCLLIGPCDQGSKWEGGERVHHGSPSEVLCFALPLLLLDKNSIGVDRNR